MTDSELIQAVNEILTDSFEIAPDRLTLHARLFADLGLDSLDAVDLVASLQKKLGVSIRSDDRMHSIQTTQDLYDYLIALKAAK
jgi:acyl carrier protein